MLIIQGYYRCTPTCESCVLTNARWDDNIRHQKGIQHTYPTEHSRWALPSLLPPLQDMCRHHLWAKIPSTKAVSRAAAMRACSTMRPHHSMSLGNSCRSGVICDYPPYVKYERQAGGKRCLMSFNNLDDLATEAGGSSQWTFKWKPPARRCTQSALWGTRGGGEGTRSPRCRSQQDQVRPGELLTRMPIKSW